MASNHTHPRVGLASWSIASTPEIERGAATARFSLQTQKELRPDAMELLVRGPELAIVTGSFVNQQRHSESVFY
jgi:hypothetical protein